MQLGEHTQSAANCIYTSSRSCIEFGSWRLREKRGDGHWGETGGGGVERGKQERLFEYHCVKTVKKIYKTFYLKVRFDVRRCTVFSGTGRSTVEASRVAESGFRLSGRHDGHVFCYNFVYVAS